MKIFLSFSGETSRLVALALHDWLRRVIQVAVPWISDRDIDSGATWTDVVAVNLRTSHMGIVCLTP